MPTQLDFLQTVFSALADKRTIMSAGEQRLLADFENRATMGPALTSHDINYLDVWLETLTQRGKDHDAFIAGTKERPKAE